MNATQRYRASVYISGAETEHVYGTNPERVKAKAIKLLTANEPGFGNTRPDRIELRRQTRTVSGNRALWEDVETVRFASIPADQHEWSRRRENKQAAP